MSILKPNQSEKLLPKSFDKYPNPKPKNSSTKDYFITSLNRLAYNLPIKVKGKHSRKGKKNGL